jgi:hypothetical protein
MDTTQAYEAITTVPGTRVSRDLADRALLSAQAHGYHGIELSDGGTLAVRFGAEGFTVETLAPAKAATGHAADPNPEQSAYDVCERCGQPITLAFDGTGRMVTTLTNNPECYGRSA